MFNKISRCRDITQRTSSDHIAIVTEIDWEEIELANQPRLGKDQIAHR